jgi:hypothetical protein
LINDFEINKNTDEINIVLEVCLNGKSHNPNIQSDNHCKLEQKPPLEIPDKLSNDSNNFLYKKQSNYLPKIKDLDV